MRLFTPTFFQFHLLSFKLVGITEYFYREEQLSIKVCGYVLCQRVRMFWSWVLNSKRGFFYDATRKHYLNVLIPKCSRQQVLCNEVSQDIPLYITCFQNRPLPPNRAILGHLTVCEIIVIAFFGVKSGQLDLERSVKL